MSDRRADTQDRVAAVERAIPRPPDDVAPLREAFTRMVSKQWRLYVPPALAGCEEGMAGAGFAKGRFIAEMYARACYSMLLVSRRGPVPLRAVVRAASLLPSPRGLTIELASLFLARMERLLPRAVHRQLLLMSALMGMLDVVLDDAASSGKRQALRVASLTTRHCPGNLQPEEKMVAALARAARRAETAWQEAYWLAVLQPAVARYCETEVRAVEGVPDLTGMGHRSAGIDAAIKGMWYVAGPRMGLEDASLKFEREQWNREQQWMADTTLLMQMIDDWVDQDEDRGQRLTPVATGDWTLASAAGLFDKTVSDLCLLLHESGIRSPVLQSILADLYRDYLHTALDAMRSGIAA